MNILQKFDKYIENINKKDKIAIIHDTDPDGICSAIITAKAIERIKGKKPALIKAAEEKKNNKRIKRFVKQKEITKLISLDISLDQDAKNLEKISKKISVLILDHHKMYLHKQIKNVVLVKPQLISKIKPYEYCTAKMAYDLFSRLINIKELDWVAAVASIADIAHKPWKEWLKKVFKKNKIRLKKNLFKTKLGKIASMISSAEVLDKNNIKKCILLYITQKNPNKLLRKNLSRYEK